MRKQILFITIFLTIGVSWLWPNFGYAFFQEPFTAMASSFITIGSTLDQSVNAIVDVAKRQHSMLKRSVATGKHRMLGAKEAAGKEITRLRHMATDGQANLKSHITNNIQFSISKTQNLALSTTHYTQMAAAQLTEFSIAIKTLVLQTSSFALQATKDTSESITETALALVSSLQSSHNSPSPSYLKRGTQESFSEERLPQTLPLTVRGTEGVREDETPNSSPLRIIERIIEKVVVKESSNDKAQMSNQIQNPNDKNSNMQDPRINSLITNVADLTSRIDGGNAGGSSAPSNAALFNMIAQSQRIKRLDDVTITNASIEGYATSKGVSDSLATYLPLGGHTHRRSHRNLSYALYHP